MSIKTPSDCCLVKAQTSIRATHPPSNLNPLFGQIDPAEKISCRQRRVINVVATRVVMPSTFATDQQACKGRGKAKVTPTCTIVHIL